MTKMHAEIHALNGGWLAKIMKRNLKKHEGQTASQSAAHFKHSPALLRQIRLLWGRQSRVMAGIHWRRQHGFDPVKWSLPDSGSQPRRRHARCKEASRIVRKGGGRVHVCVCVSVWGPGVLDGSPWWSCRVSEGRKRVCSCKNAWTRWERDQFLRAVGQLLRHLHICGVTPCVKRLNWKQGNQMPKQLSQEQFTDSVGIYLVSYFICILSHFHIFDLNDITALEN